MNELDDIKSINFLIKNIIERYNFLVQLSDNISNEINQRDIALNTFKSELKQDFSELKKNIQEFLVLLEEAEKNKNILINNFKDIIKKDAIERLNRRIDNLNYEQLVTKNELYKYI